MHLDEGRHFLASLGGKKVLLLCRHGPVVTGFSLAYDFGGVGQPQRACEAQLAA
ncbi:MAG: hypothetical protein H7242_11920 [Microbacteriaceae bacterium]|nr:hypothetical protein [Burkholderiaceae bacterium]